MKAKRILVGLTALAAATMSVPVFAQAKGADAGPWYLGFGLGKSHSSGGNTSGVAFGVPFSVSGLDNNQTSWQVNGGYQFTPEWGVELQYTDLGKRNGTVTFGAPLNGVATIPDTRAYQWGIAGTGTYWFNESWFGRAKLGVSSNHVSSSSVTFGGVTVATNSTSKTDVLAGVGAGYRWTPNITTRLE